MNIQDLGAVGELVSAIAVVITLIYLTFQIKQNTRSIRGATHHSAAIALASVLEPLASIEFARVWADGAEDYKSLSAVDRTSFSAFLVRTMKIWEDSYFQWQEGQLDSRIWLSAEVFMLDVLSLPGPSQWFETRSAWLDAEFVDYIQTKLLNYESAVTWDYS